MRHVVSISAALVLLICIGLTACGGGSKSNPPSTPAPTPVLSSITVTTSTPTVAAGNTVQYKATGTYSDSTAKDLTSTVAWKSSDETVATVSATGLATTLKEGTANISATSSSISGAMPLTVSAPVLTAIALTSTAATVPSGATQQVVATGTYGNNTQAPISGATWTSSDSAIISIDQTGVATAKAVTGSVDITAALGGVTSAKLVLTAADPAPKALMMFPAALNVAVFQWIKPAVYLVYTDNTVQDVTFGAEFTIDDPAVAAITDVLVGSAPGATKLHATYKTLNVAADVTVAGGLTSLAVTPKTGSVHQGGELLFDATGTFDGGASQSLKFLNWQSSDEAIAFFTAGKGGILNGMTEGAATVTASAGDMSDTADATVDAFAFQSFALAPAGPIQMAVHVTTQLAATATFSDGSNTDTQVLQNIQWSSSDPTVATVDKNGLVVSLAPGAAVITATLPGGGTQTVNVDVAHGTLDHVDITPANLAPKVGDVIQLKATAVLTDGRTFDVTPVAIWLSSDGSLALVDAKGRFTALKAGTVRIDTVFDTTFPTTITIQ